jgi:hypothetical protein
VKLNVTHSSAVFAVLSVLSITAVTVGLLISLARGDNGDNDPRPIPSHPLHDVRMAPYTPDPDHMWNRLHQTLFVREAPDGSRHIHAIDPLLFPYTHPGNTFLLEGEPYRHAITRLEEFLAEEGDQQFEDPLKRLFLQRDLWAAFDYVAWYPDEWVFRSRYEAAAIALRTRLAGIIGRLALDGHQIDALPDNYALAVASEHYLADYDPRRGDRPFLPADLFDPMGPWVRFHESTAEPMAEEHFNAAGGRAVHIIFLRLPGGREATEQYIKEVNRDALRQFPPGTMVAMVRRALAVDASAKVRVTPVTELVQIRVYRRIPENPRANHSGDFGEQDVYEFVLDRAALFAGHHGLRNVGLHHPLEPFQRSSDPFRRDEWDERSQFGRGSQIASCIQCHQAPGIHSVLSMQRGLRVDPQVRSRLFRTYAWDVEMKYTVRAKVRRFDWGLLQGLLEADADVTVATDE